jgi:hypothetical protein
MPFRPPRQLRRGTCGAGMEAYLKKGERISEVRCRFGLEYVMTDRSLLIVDRRQETEGGITLNTHFSRTDMSTLNALGIADWEPTEDSVLVLTRKSTLVRLPNEGMGDTVPVYRLGFDTSKLGRSSMTYHSGTLFIAPRGQYVVAMTFQGKAQTTLLALRSSLPDAGFFYRGERLIFGKAGVEETEIIARGDRIMFGRTK